MRPRRNVPKPDILTVAQNHIGTGDQVTVFKVLLDAAIRATRTKSLNDQKRIAALSDGAAKILDELNRSEPLQIEVQAPVSDGFKEWRAPRQRYAPGR